MPKARTHTHTESRGDVQRRLKNRTAGWKETEVEAARRCTTEGNEPAWNILTCGKTYDITLLLNQKSTLDVVYITNNKDSYLQQKFTHKIWLGGIGGIFSHFAGRRRVGGGGLGTLFEDCSFGFILRDLFTIQMCLLGRTSCVHILLIFGLEWSVKLQM